ncbi:unnamed protein product [Lactuca virosa]|uniref:Transposase MuDR plant domain-containing protein n=1 Tax=Lactuca virosa TaxID=75947 RepID=A0AAU9PK23_9ASTR|nr:unnamed protein product [Lactuca virosa]
MKHELGECYESPTQLRFALTNYEVHNGYQIYFEKRDHRVRVIARCGNSYNDQKPCPFRVATGWKYNERTFQIKSIVKTHLCARNYNFSNLVTSDWLAKHYLQDVTMKTKMTLDEMKEDVLRRFSENVSKGQCQRARLRKVIPSGGYLFEIRYTYDGYKATITYVHKDPIYFKSSWFHKDKLIATYMENILLVGGSKMWQRTDFIKPLPPLVRRMLGRPKVKEPKVEVKEHEVKENENEVVDMDIEPELEVKETGVKVMENEVENNNDDVCMIRDMVEFGYAQVEIDLTTRKVR